MSATAQATTDLGTCLVTGGAGYLGRHLVAELLRRGHRVRAFDVARIPFTHERLEMMTGDITEPGDVRKACEGIETVFHTAAVLDFRRFPGRAGWERSRAVNVGGVENLILACREAGVRRLVHTSTNNVTLEGPVVGGDETWPYAQHPKDPYTATKIEGERRALAANEEAGLLTCAIRPGGIYGPGEALMLPRLVGECAGGRFIATIGDGSAMSDNTYIENLVDGHIEAARHLMPGSPLGGQAYFVTDGAPVNYFEFFRPFVEALGIKFPTRKLPAAPLRPVFWCWELLGRFFPLPPPPLTLLELKKIVVPHYSGIEKARRDFGWSPKVTPEEAALRCLPYVIKLHTSFEKVDRPHWAWWIAIPFGMGLLALLAFSPGAHAVWSAHVTSWTPRWLLQGIFVWAALVHVYKGMKAVRMAERAGLRATSLAWGWQTFLLGFPSLARLEQRIRKRERRE
jgi:3beta-hydroxy-delta5-steroid dehydrogenase/steroid delta-isomerase